MGNLWSECVKLAVCTAVAVVSIFVCNAVIGASRSKRARRESECKCKCQQDDAVMHFHGPKDSIPYCANSNCKLNFKEHCILREPTVRCLDYIPKTRPSDNKTKEER